MGNLKSDKNALVFEPARSFRLDNISKYFGKNPGLIDTNLTLNKGEIHCVCGANSAGKSTMVKLIAGLLKPDKGEITRPKKSKIGIMLDENMLYPKLSIAENLKFHARLNGVKKPEKLIERLLEKTELADLRFEKIETLSAGMKKRSAFARAILNEPELLLLDEPFSGIDKSASVKLETCIKELAEKDSAVLITTHRVRRVIEFCDEVSVLDNGRLIITEKIDSIIDKQTFCRDYLSYPEQKQ